MAKFLIVYEKDYVNQNAAQNAAKTKEVVAEGFYVDASKGFIEFYGRVVAGRVRPIKFTVRTNLVESVEELGAE